MKPLYPFQQELVDKLRDHWRAGVQIVGLWSATGAGIGAVMVVTIIVWVWL